MSESQVTFRLKTRRHLERKAAMGCLLVNAIVMPGSGTLYAGRRTGYLQMLLVLAGLGLHIAYLWILLQSVLAGGGLIAGDPVAIYEVLSRDLETFNLDHATLLGAAKFGTVLLLTGWGWSILSGILIVREARHAVPPIIQE